MTQEVAARLDVVTDNVFLEGDLTDLEALEADLQEGQLHLQAVLQGMRVVVHHDIVTRLQCEPVGP